MNEPTDKPTGPQESEAQAPKAPPKPKILWKAVEPRHYLAAQGIKAASGKTAYNAYVVSLVERLEGEEPKDLTKAQQEAVLSAFEEKFGEK